MLKSRDLMPERARRIVRAIKSQGRQGRSKNMEWERKRERGYDAHENPLLKSYTVVVEIGRGFGSRHRKR